LASIGLHTGETNTPVNRTLATVNLGAAYGTDPKSDAGDLLDGDVWGAVKTRLCALQEFFGVRLKSLAARQIVPVGAKLAREKRLNNAIIQTARVNVDVHREQARSYRETSSIAIRPAGRPPRFCFGF
jgi:hypothetical protein